MTKSDNILTLKFETPKLSFSLDDKEFDFSTYQTFGDKFITKLVSAFEGWIKPKSIDTRKTYYYRVCELLDWMKEQNEDGRFNKLFKLINFNHIRSVLDGKKDWDLMLGYFRSDLADQNTISWRTKDNTLSVVKSFLRAMTLRGVVPHVEKLKKFKWQSRQKKSIAEISPVWDKNVNEINNTMSEVLGLSEYECEQTKDFIETLIESGENLSARDELPQQILSLLEKRLSVLREAAEKEFNIEYTKYKKGQKLITECDWDIAKFEEVTNRYYYLLDTNQCRKAGHILSEYYPPNDVGLGRILKLITLTNKSIMPYEHDENEFTTTNYGQFIQRIVWNKLNLSVREIAAHLYASSELLNAIAVILMIDTSINVHSCRTVDRACLAESNLSGHVSFLWWKERNGGYQLIRDLELNAGDSVSPAIALQVLIETTEVLSNAANNKHKNYCFYATEQICNANDGARIRNVSGKTYLDWFKSFLKRHSELESLNFTLDMIRPSVLLKVALVTRDPSAVKEVGQQKSYSVALRYVDKIPNKIIGEKRIRIFMEWLQILTSVNIDNFAEKIGIDKDKYEEEKKKILEQTFGGITCGNPLSGEQDGVNKGEVCWKIDQCLTCTQREDVVVASIGNILSVMQWRERLLEAKEQLTSDNPEWWGDKWLLWDIFTKTMLTKWKVGVHRAMYKKAMKLLDSTSNPYPNLIELTA